jgi:5,10-methylenetetrahydromethanopterin reductase
MGPDAGAQIALWAPAAEAAGAGSVWLSEDCFYPSALALAAAAATTTRTVPIGIGVVNPYTRHPALLAMEAATLSQLAPNRIVLGLGTSNRDWIEGRLGIAFREPLQALRECVEIVDRLWRGERITTRGRCFSVDAAALEFKPADAALPIVLGMKSAAGLRLAGEIADGVLLSGLPSPGHVTRARRNVAAGRQHADRRDSCTIAAYVATCVDDDGRRARDRVRAVLAEHLGIMHAQSILRDAGLTEADTLPFREHLAAQRPAAQLVSDDLVRRFAIAGTPDECRQALAPLAAAGLDVPIAMLPPGPDPITDTRRIVAELAESWTRLKGRRS